MQGSYKQNGLPRPYYMKPSAKKRSSPYDNVLSFAFFTTARRKVLGYVLLLMLFGTCMYWVAHDMKSTGEPTYEIIKPNNNMEKTDNIDKIVNFGSKADKEIENVDLAGNLAQGSKGDKGLGVVEAPKGGAANEAPVVGSDEDRIVGTGKNPKGKIVAGPIKGEPVGYKASRED
jgi:hypothetical protein